MKHSLLKRMNLKEMAKERAKRWLERFAVPPPTEGPPSQGPPEPPQQPPAEPPKDGERGGSRGEFWLMLGFLFLWIIAVEIVGLLTDDPERTVDTAYPLLMGLIGVIVWASGFVLLSEREKGARVTLGNPDKFVTNGNGFFGTGLHWTLWPLQKIIKVPTAQQQMDFEVSNVITAPGTFPIKGTEEKEELGAATIKIDAATYFLWPDGNDLLAAIREAGAISTEELKKFTQNTVLDAIRKIAGTKTWREVVIDREQLEHDVEAVVSRPDNPLARARIISGEERDGKWQITDTERFSLAILNVQLPPELDKAILQPEVMRLEGEGIKRKARGEAEAIRMKGLGEADARKAMLQVVKEYGADLEALDVLRDMAQGPATTIFYNLPERLYDAMTRTLGGVRPEEMFKMLAPDAQKEVQQLLLEKLKQVAQPKGGIP